MLYVNQKDVLESLEFARDDMQSIIDNRDAWDVNDSSNWDALLTTVERAIKYIEEH
jgi:hypothetical protein